MQWRALTPKPAPEAKRVPSPLFCPLQPSLSNVLILPSYPRGTLGEKGLRHFTCLYITYLL